MYALNKAQIIGFAASDPEVRETSSGIMVTNLDLEIKSLADNPNSDKPYVTSFVSVTLWRGLAEIAKNYIKKGSQVYVSGPLETSSWETDDGKKKSKTRIVGDDIILLSPKDGNRPALPEGLQITGGLNKAEIIGNITQNPELRTTPNNNMVTSFGLATNSKYKDSSGEFQEKTEFHNIVVWGDLAEEVSKHLKKGTKIYADGRIQTRSWETPDGEKRYTTEIVTSKIKTLGCSIGEGSGNASTKKEETKESSSESTKTPEINYETEIKPEDLPF